jgi:hypothetical protein
VLGPILGLVTQDSVKVMVEVDCAAELFLHVFRMDPLVQEGEFSHVEVGLPLTIMSIVSSYCNELYYS